MLDAVATAQDHAQALKDIPVEEVAAAMERLRAWDENRRRLHPMSDDEINVRYAMLTGRGNGTVLRRKAAQA
jgi:hypothetical protein